MRHPKSNIRHHIIRKDRIVHRIGTFLDCKLRVKSTSQVAEYVLGDPPKKALWSSVIDDAPNTS